MLNGSLLLQLHYSVVYASDVKQATFTLSNSFLQYGDVITHINHSSSSLLLDLLRFVHHLHWIQQLFNLSVFFSAFFFKTPQLGFHLVRFSLLGLDGLRKWRANMKYQCAYFTYESYILEWESTYILTDRIHKTIISTSTIASITQY